MNIRIILVIYSDEPKATKGLSLFPIHFRDYFYHTFMRVRGHITKTLETVFLISRQRMRAKVWRVFPRPIKSAKMHP